LEEKTSEEFSDILDQFKILKVNQYINWEKISHVERDVEKLKKII